LAFGTVGAASASPPPPSLGGLLSLPGLLSPEGIDESFPASVPPPTVLSSPLQPAADIPPTAPPTIAAAKPTRTHFFFCIGTLLEKSRRLKDPSEIPPRPTTHATP
jgi:hypothetical protein